MGIATSVSFRNLQNVMAGDPVKSTFFKSGDSATSIRQ